MFKTFLGNNIEVFTTITRLYLIGKTVRGFSHLPLLDGVASLLGPVNNVHIYSYPWSNRVETLTPALAVASQKSPLFRVPHEHFEPFPCRCIAGSRELSFAGRHFCSAQWPNNALHDRHQMALALTFEGPYITILYNCIHLKKLTPW